ncbi:MAG TPA: hypothetical protein VE046_09175 [Steroidobacteraceae bacterium]|nr:hypothetical protein [Steroidobacteraceae bacterium]
MAVTLLPRSSQRLSLRSTPRQDDTTRPVRRKSRRKSRTPRLAYRRARDNERVVADKRLHGGKGTVGVKWIFGRQGYARPAQLYTYDIPPGASEGVHTHARGDRPLMVYLVAMTRD